MECGNGPVRWSENAFPSVIIVAKSHRNTHIVNVSTKVKRRVPSLRRLVESLDPE